MRNPAERGRPSTSRMARPDTTRVNASGRTTRNVPIAPKKNNTPLIIGGSVGGLVLLIVIIAAASSGSSAPKSKPKKAAEPVAVAEPKSTVTKQDTGPITFACTGMDGKHPEKESTLSRCPKCDARSRFFWDYNANKFSCFQCKTLLDKADVKCPDCGGPPARSPYIKHRPE